MNAATSIANFKNKEVTFLNKIDPIPHLGCDVEMALASIENIYPGMPIFEISAKTQKGFHC